MARKRGEIKRSLFLEGISLYRNSSFAGRVYKLVATRLKRGILRMSVILF
jgi:hypothetical protein